MENHNQKMLPQLNRLWQRGAEFLGCPYAIMAGAMTWVSEANLVSAISNAGGFGVVASGSMPPEILDAEIKKTQAKTNKPFGVNLIVMHPQLEELAKTCLANNVSHVVLAGGLPPAPIIKLLKEGGAKTMALPPTLALAKRFIKQGIDALIIEGMEAGGHIGPVSTSVLAQEILPHIHEVPVFVAGGIGHGAAILSYLEMGASGVQMGTRFVCTDECQVHENFKKAFLKANARDAMPSAQLDPRFPVIPVRAIQNKASQDFMAKQREMIDRFDKGAIDLKSAQLEIEHFWAGALRRAAIDGDIENGSLMAGQSVGMIDKVEPVADVIHTLIDQSLTVLALRSAQEVA